MKIADSIEHVTVDKAAEMINKSPHSVRQLLLRNKLKKHLVGHRVCVDLTDVLTYHAKKKKIPSWEENITLIKDRGFVSIMSASSALMVQPVYLIRLIQKKTLEGYVTIAGDIMVSRDSINAYLRIPTDADTSTL